MKFNGNQGSGGSSMAGVSGGSVEELVSDKLLKNFKCLRILSHG